jgi:hypothetical protein
MSESVVQAPALGSNLPNSVADVHVSFPVDWLALLREMSPVTDLHSYLLPYWYRAAERWVLYDALPHTLIDPDDLLGPGFSGEDFFTAVNGPAPRDCEPWQRTPFLSDVQHEMYRVHQVYARPLWVLQGDKGGHFVGFDPWQKNLLAAQRKPTEPPAIKSLPACPFDNRAVQQLRRHNRLTELKGSIAKLRKSGSSEAAEAMLQKTLREIRESELALLEDQIDPLLDVSHSVSHRSDSRDHLFYTEDGSASKASDALDQYIETGEFTY